MAKIIKFTDLKTKYQKNNVKAWYDNAKIEGSSKDNLEWIKKNHKKIYDFIKQKYQEINTRKWHLSTLGILLRDFLGETDEEVYNKYITEGNKLVKITDLETEDHKNKVKAWHNNAKIEGSSLDDLKWIKKNHKKLYDYIKKKYPKINTRKGHLSTLGVLLRNFLGETDEEVYNKYIDEGKNLDKQSKKESKKQKLTPKEEKNFVDLDEVVKKRKELKEKFEKDPENREKMFQYLFVSLQSYIPPLRRQEYRDMEIVYEKPTDKKKNYLLDDDSGKYKYTVIINKDKVSNKKGSGQFPIDSVTLAKIIDKTLLYFKRKYLFSGLTNGNKPMNKNVFSKNIINKIFAKEKKHVTLNTYRKAFITHYWNKPNFSIYDKEKLAKRMRHSINIADLSYKKIMRTIDEQEDDLEDDEDDDESSDDESSDDEVEEKKEKKQVKKKKEVSDDESSDDEVEEKKEKKEVKKKKFNKSEYMKKYNKSHKSQTRKYSRKYYNNNRDIVLRNKLLAKINIYKLTKKPTQKSIDKYNLVYDKKSKTWK